VYPSPKDWVFASPLALGKLPYWPDAVLKRHVYPAAERAGITKRIGWHSFRRTLATLLQSSGASAKTTQELLRHASPGITMGIYAKAVTADKRQAQDIIAALFVGNSNQSAATAASAQCGNRCSFLFPRLFLSCLSREAKLLKIMVGTTRFELATSPTPRVRSTRLSHVPTCVARIVPEDDGWGIPQHQVYTSHSVFRRQSSHEPSRDQPN
jgi:hypothetical protein